MPDTKPTWHKGDILAMPADLQPWGNGVANGCAVFVAEHEPRFDGVWLYGHRPARELRLATTDDIDRLIAIHFEKIGRAKMSIDKLQLMREKVDAESKARPTMPNRDLVERLEALCVNCIMAPANRNTAMMIPCCITCKERHLAAAEIRRLRTEITEWGNNYVQNGHDQLDELAQLRADNERLRKALEAVKARDLEIMGVDAQHNHESYYHIADAALAASDTEKQP